MASNEKRARDTLFLGFELEVEPRLTHDADRREGGRVLSTVGERWLWAKHDGSLRNGFEIVSHPFTWAFFTEAEKQAPLADIFSRLLQIDFISQQSERCGLHVHFSRRATSRTTLYKMIRFIYSDTRFVTEIGQRPITDDYVERYANFGLPLEDVIRKAAGNLDDGRYVAVNTVMANTIELRFMKGTLNIDAFMKSVEFCVALHEFCRETAITNITTDVFLKWLKSGHYPYLYAFLQWTGRLPGAPKSQTRRTMRSLYDERP